MAEDQYANLIAENARRRAKNRELAQRVAELERERDQFKQLAEEREQALEEQAAEFAETLEGLSESDLVQTIDRLNAEIVQRDLAAKFTEKAGGKLAAGAKFESVMKLMGIDPAGLDPNEIDDSFIETLVAEAQAQAPYLFKPEEPAEQAGAQNGQSRDIAAAAVRRLPTFATVRGSGGGAPPPAENPGSTARLRDPADAIRRAAEARAARTQSPSD